MTIVPGSPEELAESLAEAGSRNQRITLLGHCTKGRMGGPIAPSDVTISTAGLNKVLEYEPRDLTISVGAGILYCELSRILAEHRQMIPLDPPFSDRTTLSSRATMAGIVAANTCGPRRRLYGSARDMVIGMTFATLEGKLVRTGGMVVKNVAGLDMGKLMIGSFGTLAAIATLNFRLYPMPAGTRTFVQDFNKIADVMAARDEVLKGRLQPAAIDIVKNGGSYQLAIQAGGSATVLDRYSRELSRMRVLEGAEEETLWRGIREATPQFLRTHENGAVLRVSCVLSDVGRVLESLPAQASARAGSGVCYGYFEQATDLNDALRHPQVGTSVVEFAPPEFREKAGLHNTPLWPRQGSDFAMMKKIKEMFDPQGLLNRGRLYGRI
ncbi:MAG: FAD-binding oxidoreductase [Bryobacteraceae bacterium]|jgi:glycolate oxidase FAD binding subunit